MRDAAPGHGAYNSCEGCSNKGEFLDKAVRWPFCSKPEERLSCDQLDSGYFAKVTGLLPEVSAFRQDVVSRNLGYMPPGLGCARLSRLLATDHPLPMHSLACRYVNGIVHIALYGVMGDLLDVTFAKQDPSTRQLPPYTTNHGMRSLMSKRGQDIVAPPEQSSGYICIVHDRGLMTMHDCQIFLESYSLYVFDAEALPPKLLAMWRLLRRIVLILLRCGSQRGGGEYLEGADAAIPAKRPGHPTEGEQARYMFTLVDQLVDSVLALYEEHKDKPYSARPILKMLSYNLHRLQCALRIQVCDGSLHIHWNP